MALPRIVWLLVDGLPHELVCAYSAARPNSKLAALHAQQRIAALTPLAPNCQTPPSLFTIWSGCEPDKHGLLGYDIPKAVDGDPTAYVDGFQAWPRDVRMVWDLYADQLRTIRTCAVPFVQADRLSPWLLSATEVFGPPLAAPCVLGNGETLSIAALALALRVEADDGEIVLRDEQGRERWHCALVSPQPSNAGGSRRSRSAGQGATTSHGLCHGEEEQRRHALREPSSNRHLSVDATPGPGPAEDPCPLSVEVPSDTHFALCLRGAWIDGLPKLICLGYHSVRVHGTDAEARKRQGCATPYVVANPGKLYAVGALGRRMDEGGEGLAEQLLVSLMHDVHVGFAADILGAVQADDADLVVGYYPVIDLLCHQLLRYAADGDQQLKGPLAGAFIDVMDWLDTLIAELAERIGPQARFIVNSDHGMLPIEWEVSPNVFFAQRGWLARRPDGAIDPTRSIAFFHPAENGLLAFHLERLGEIGMTPADVIDALAAAVTAAGLPGLGAIPGAAAPLGSAWRSDLYLQAPAGARARAHLDDALVKRSPKGGDHTVHSSQPWLRGTLIDAGVTRWLAPGKDELALAQLLSVVMAPPSPTSTATGAGIPDKTIPDLCIPPPQCQA